MKKYFDLEISHLQRVSQWSAASVQIALAIYASFYPNDTRIQYAISAGNEFQNNGKRTNHLRKLAMEAYKASRETKIEQASYAANAASLFAAIAYTHPFRDRNQAKHILGTIVNAAIAVEIEQKDKKKSDRLVDDEIEKADQIIKNLLLNYPRQILGPKRIDELFYRIDNGIIIRKYNM